MRQSRGRQCDTALQCDSVASSHGSRSRLDRLRRIHQPPADVGLLHVEIAIHDDEIGDRAFGDACRVSVSPSSEAGVVAHSCAASFRERPTSRTRNRNTRSIVATLPASVPSSR